MDKLFSFPSVEQSLENRLHGQHLWRGRPLLCSLGELNYSSLPPGQETESETDEKVGDFHEILLPVSTESPGVTRNSQAP